MQFWRLSITTAVSEYTLNRNSNENFLFIIPDPFRFPNVLTVGIEMKTQTFFSPQAVTSFHLPVWESSYVTKGYACKSEYKGISWVQMNCYCNAAAPSNVQENSYYDEANIASPPKNSLISKLFTHINFFSPCSYAFELFCSHL